MITRLISAGARAFLVALLIATPALVLPGVSNDTTQMISLLCLLGALLTFVEYYGDYPSLIEFRNAPPFNRMRFLALFVTIALLTLIARGETDPSGLSTSVTQLGAMIGRAMDFPFSPVRLMVLMAPDNATTAEVSVLRTYAGMAYLISLAVIILFVACVKVLNWPIRRCAFNFWVNLPLFDPTAGGDVLARLKRDSHVNVALGFLLPFLIPAVLKMVSPWIGPIAPSDPHTLIWTMSAWAFLPASLIMRGVALMRIADLIEEKRRRAYAQAATLQAA